jgi:hypothetical protein
MNLSCCSSYQRLLWSEIEAEQAIVSSNRELIRRMEVKVKAAVDRVWVTDLARSSSDSSYIFCSYWRLFSKG